MIAEKYLQTIRDMRHEIEYLKKAREDVAKDIGYMSPSGMNPDRVQSSGRKDGLEMTAIRHMKRLGAVDKKIHNMILEYNAKRVKVVVLIHRMPDDQRRRVLIDYYLEGKSVEQLAEEYRYENTKSVYNLKKRAVKLFAKSFEKDIQEFDKNILQKVKKNEKNNFEKPAQSLAAAGLEEK